MAGDATDIVVQFDLGLAGEENLVADGFQGVLDAQRDRLRDQGRRFGLALGSRVMQQDAHAQPPPGAAARARRHLAAAAASAVREKALGFELAQRRPHRGLGNLQLRAQADHPGHLAPPLPGSQPLAQMGGGLIGEREAG